MSKHDPSLQSRNCVPCWQLYFVNAHKKHQYCSVSGDMHQAHLIGVIHRQQPWSALFKLPCQYCDRNQLAAVTGMRAHPHMAGAWKVHWEGPAQHGSGIISQSRLASYQPLAMARQVSRWRPFSLSTPKCTGVKLKQSVSKIVATSMIGRQLCCIPPQHRPLPGGGELLLHQWTRPILACFLYARSCCCPGRVPCSPVSFSLGPDALATPTKAAGPQEWLHVGSGCKGCCLG